ncbi:hypothetical protein Rt10032_c08g3421 [Rhodotorula toruloides]|uniref:Uncharacterized protein n=1 Tax=Rhodotorula toruloides TaxID=5286 RepID=A0A511KIY2_RHOTO|nr:hypothetical protein Rt10032_c08g3421 [Rhodotorula toruloides]
MASHAATHHATTRIGHTSTLTAILQAHGRFGQIDHAFVGAAGSIVRLTAIMQETDRLRHFFERDDFLERTLCTLLCDRISSRRPAKPSALPSILLSVYVPSLLCVMRRLKRPTDKVHNAQPAASSPRAHLVPHGLEELNLPHKGILSAAAWERDISHLMSAEDYVERAQRLGALLVASEEPAEANEKPVNLLVEQSARMEMVQTGYNPNSRSEESRDLLADLMMGWEQVIKVLKKRFAVSDVSALLCVSADLAALLNNLAQPRTTPSRATSTRSLANERTLSGCVAS